MNDKEGLNLLDFLASGINKNDPVIQAILSDYNGNGATANELDELIEFINYYTRTDDVKANEGENLEMIVKQFTKLRRQLEESDKVLLRRMRALTERGGDTVWGTATDIEHVFERPILI
jgi:peptidoglycan hydrolase CwlO-like protein